jgi:hypothetical protein
MLKTGFDGTYEFSVKHLNSGSWSVA